MKLATFDVNTAAGPDRRVGIVTGDSLIDLTEGYAAVLARKGATAPTEIANAVVPPTMLDVLERGERALEAARETRAALDGEPDGTGPGGGQLAYDLKEVGLRSPIPRPPSIRDFAVYEEHISKGFPNGLPDVWYNKPVYYQTSASSVVGPDADVEWPAYSETRDYELELAAVIGKRGHNLEVDEADEYIAGYTIFNDFSARDAQFEEMKLNLGPSKGKHFANGLGPYLVTADAIDTDDLDMRASVNGTVVTDGSSAGMQHSWAEMVAYASQGETLYPGDILGSGTIGNGCGWENDVYLEVSDEVALDVEGIGTLRNSIT
jgi:2-keto-4-pentenoate hydratase/2-oxohepta-3-ene-1,7-dioic acid hydratase in catechol pathway